MEEALLLEAVERYLEGKMPPAEKEYFEHLRSTTPELDQMVVSHRFLLQQMESYRKRKLFKDKLMATHQRLVSEKTIPSGANEGKVAFLWNKYKKLTAIAASIAGITALTISILVASVSPSSNKTDLEQLNRKVSNLERTTNALNSEIKNKHTIQESNFVSGGTGFLIDANGYLVTNAHVLKGSGAVVADYKGNEYNATILHIDHQKDLAILRIDDSTFQPMNAIPYSIKRSGVDLGEELYTLGFPRDSIVYNMGYLSAKSGYNGDTATYQLSLTANPGNSGGPVFNKNGEIIGVLSTRQVQAEGVVFAIKSKNIFNMINDLRDKDSSIQKINILSGGNLKNLNRVDQIKRVEDFVFLVKAYTK